MSAVSTTTKASRTARRYKTLGYYAAFIALGLTHAALGPTLADLAARTGVSLDAISYGFAARALGYLMGSFLGGRLYDRAPGHPVMMTMLLLISAVMAGIPVVTTLAPLILLLLLLGMFEGALDVGGNTLIVWVHGDKVAPFMNALHFFYGVGATLSPLVIAQAVALSGDIRWAYWALALLVMPAALLVARQPSPRSRDEAEAGDNARRASPGLVALVALFFFLYVGAEGSFGGWIATYARVSDLGDAVTAAYLTSVFWGALTAGRLASIPIAQRFSPQQVLLGDLVGCVISVGAIVLWPRVPWVVWAGTFGAGLSMASMFPTMISLAERHMPITGAVTGWFFVGASTGGMTLPWLIGQLFPIIGPRVTVVAILVNVLLDVAIFTALLLFLRRTSQRGDLKQVNVSS
jgi:FHS family Na+ dependent glucose MFS transporter 1